MVDGLDVVGVRHVGELIELMGGDATYTIPDTPVTDETTTDQSPTSHPNDCGDMNEVLGQEHAKWALQVAAAGGHNLIMTGPPGSGKTMLASRMPGIMCPLNEAEQLEVASIRSLCGILLSTASPTCRRSRHRTTPPARRPWWVVAAASPFPAQSHARIEAFCFWTRHRNSAHAPCRRCANHWNPGMWRFPVQKAAPTTRPHSNSSWRPTPVRADTITAPANVALAGKRPYTLFLAIVRTDTGSCGYSDGGATSLAHCRAKRANRRVQCRDTSSCDSCPSSGQRPVQTVWMGVQRASFGQMAARQYIAESDGIGQSGPVQSSTHIARG